MLNYAKSSRGSKYHILGSDGKALCKYKGYNTRTPVNVLPDGAVVCKSCLMIKGERDDVLRYVPPIPNSVVGSEKEVMLMPRLVDDSEKRFEVTVEFWETVIAKDKEEAKQFLLKLILERKVKANDITAEEV